MAEFTTQLKFIASIVGDEKFKKLETSINKVSTGSVGRLNTALNKTDARINKIANTNVRKLESGFDSLGKSISGVGKSLSLKLTLPLVALGTVAVRNFGKQQAAIAKLEAGIASTGNAAGISSQKLQDIAADLQKISTFGDEEILGDVTSTLLTFTGISGTVFEDTQKAVVDLSARLGQDLKSSAIQLGKAINDPVTGISALTRVGITFSDAQKDVISGLVETNDLAGAQAVILKELNTQFGGSAEAIAAVGTGPIQQLGNSIGDLLEDFGEFILDGINPFIEKITELVDFLKNLDDSQKQLIVTIGGVAAAIGPLLIAFGTLTTFGAPFLAQITKIGATLIQAKGGISSFAFSATKLVTIYGGLALIAIKVESSFKIFSTTLDGLVVVAKEFGSALLDIGSSLIGITPSVDDASESSFSFLGVLTKLTALPLAGFFAAFSRGIKSVVDGLLALDNVPFFNNLISDEVRSNLFKAQVALEKSIFELTKTAQNTAGEIVGLDFTLPVRADTEQAEKDLQALRDKLKKDGLKVDAEIEDEKNQSGTGELDDETNRLIDNLSKTEETSSQLAENIKGNLASSFTDLFSTFADGTESASAAFSSFASSVLDDITKILLRQSLLSALGPVFSTGGTTAGTAAAAVPAGFATGGLVSGEGTGTSDSIPAMLSNGEFVIREKAVRAIGASNLRALNNLSFNVPKFATGGLVGESPVDSSSSFTPNVSINVENSGTQKSATVTNQSFDGKNLVLSVLLEDINNNGTFTQGIGGAFGLKRKG